MLFMDVLYLHFSAIFALPQDITHVLINKTYNYATIRNYTVPNGDCV